MLGMFPLESRMLSTPFRWFFNLCLCLVIFASAEIGQVIGLQELPLAISVVWPATGFSLAAIMLFGFKAWPGIFLGNFIYNAGHLYLANPHVTAVVAGFVVTCGSLLQACVGGYILRRFSSPSYFGSLREVAVFLLPGGLLPCLIGSSVGTLTLYLYATLPSHDATYIWVTFWLGDVMGIYIIAPLLVVWLLHGAVVSIRQHQLETCGMVLGFLGVTYLTFIQALPLLHLSIPLGIWISYRYRMRGATLITFVIALSTVFSVAYGYGPGLLHDLSNQLLLLASFLSVGAIANLVVAAVIDERERARHLLQLHNTDLQGIVEMHVQKLKELHSDLFVKEKMASLGVLTYGIAKLIGLPLEKIRSITTDCLHLLNELKGNLGTQKGEVDAPLLARLEQHIGNMEGGLATIIRNERIASRWVGLIEQQSQHTLPGRNKVVTINLNTLLTKCLEQSLETKKKEYPDFYCTVAKEYDGTLKMIEALPDDLASAFLHLFDNAFDAMIQKAASLGRATYKPQLTVRTRDHRDHVEVVIRDNGIGVTQERLETFFSLLNGPQTEDHTGLGLFIAHQMIVRVHQGGVKARSKSGEYLELILTLPKPHHIYCTG